MTMLKTHADAIGTMNLEQHDATRVTFFAGGIIGLLVGVVSLAVGLIIVYG